MTGLESTARHRTWARRLADMPVRLKAALIVVPTALAAVVSTGFGLWSSADEASLDPSEGLAPCLTVSA
ncbi:hypothetical protein D0Q02_31370 [Micromonospora craniellae]|uniref:Uncharacterized protein n=1 Tax=Micromonospora craniellae TaxID=2294034 RepID=A0A372FQI0_9ACTN|nr:hypothetical protein D0Q02_31370 [Micromonospora craniellae]